MLIGLINQYALWTGLTFSFPYIFYNLIIYFPNSFSFGEGFIVTSAFVYNFWTSVHNILEKKIAIVENSPDTVLITTLQEVQKLKINHVFENHYFYSFYLIFKQVIFLLLIMGARSILLFMKPRKCFALQEIFSLCTKAAFGTFISKLNNPLDDIWYFGSWFFSYLFMDTKHVS